ncbi:MAG: endonuclease V [Candidatus Bathyarchaeota archaeon]|jgi:deoxyribonuclease V|nr:endonuclease V [Candidatus Bathyarchaeota archaeon]
MSKKIVRENVLPERIRCVAGVDVAYLDGFSIGAVVSIRYASLCTIESKAAYVETGFPYIPTLLAFREVPPAVKAIRALETPPDVILVDGHGVMHPRRLGFASHLGLVLNKPTIGVAKSPMVGKLGEYNKEHWAPIVEEGEVVGAALRTRPSKAVYISTGHMVSLEKAIGVARQVTQNSRVPEPIRLAHNRAERERQRIKAANL